MQWDISPALHKPVTLQALGNMYGAMRNATVFLKQGTVSDSLYYNNNLHPEQNIESEITAGI